jgi:hypothetical protein
MFTEQEGTGMASDETFGPVEAQKANPLACQQQAGPQPEPAQMAKVCDSDFRNL